MANSHTVILIAMVSAYQSGAASLKETKTALTSAGYVCGKLILYYKYYCILNAPSFLL